ncbi:hypothetical protein FOZ60_007988 [Perkinsus olseni]|uniref:Uncharacterized protein n=1 Tax=Perkinsus olseni TaxID=32597 RepID=A0A7J6NLN8_PEROL|nr:hypothetical protein FOZ60_007988 [Perkinsus olseni]
MAFVNNTVCCLALAGSLLVYLTDAQGYRQQEVLYGRVHGVGTEFFFIPGDEAAIGDLDTAYVLGISGGYDEFRGQTSSQRDGTKTTSLWTSHLTGAAAGDEQAGLLAGDDESNALCGGKHIRRRLAGDELMFWDRGLPKEFNLKPLYEVERSRRKAAADVVDMDVEEGAGLLATDDESNVLCNVGDAAGLTFVLSSIHCNSMSDTTAPGGRLTGQHNSNLHTRNRVGFHSTTTTTSTAPRAAGRPSGAKYETVTVDRSSCSKATPPYSSECR